MLIRIQRHRLSEMLQAVRAFEAQGYECACPIQKIRKSKKIFNYDDRKERFSLFSGVSEYEYYFVKMRKVD
ncbi:hypothetical protein H839_08089 [Parageobacillus genomosp. 1]|uniref:Uncharacterized protein n=1 Tax=Parageobacillus genomosp. 1 TaxID=1295642 RepID=A0ABC9VGF1_9BACL|nr:hypothetical protein H839_08089 [Parageobacillus genomosp. 1]